MLYFPAHLAVRSVQIADFVIMAHVNVPPVEQARTKDTVESTVNVMTTPVLTMMISCV